MAAPGTIAQYSRLIDPGVRKHFIDRYNQVKPNLEYAFKVEDARDQAEVESLYSGLSSLSTVQEGVTIPEDAPLQTYQTTYTQVKYATLASISYETKLWEKDNLVSDMPAQEAKTAARKVETLGASVYNNGFTTANTSYGDGKPLFSTDHDQAGGGASQSNASSTGITLTESNLETAQLALEQILDDRGEAVAVYADCLVVPPALRKEALIITKSEYRSETANNDLNVYNGSMAEYAGATLDKVVCWKFLGSYLGGSDTAWYLLDKNEHLIKWKWGEKPNIERDDSVGFKNDLMYWKVRLFASHGWSDYRGSWGSQGDGAAYSS